MANPDKHQKSSFSSLNIIILIIAICTIGYFTFNYTNPQIDVTKTKTDYFNNLNEDIPEVVTLESTDIDTSVNEDANEEDKPITFFDERSNDTEIINEVVVDENSQELTPALLLETEEIENPDTDVLKTSDQSIYSKLAEFGQQTTELKALLHDDILRNTIIFIENFRQGYFISKFSPMVAPGEKFSVRSKEQDLIIDTSSYQRYDDYADYIYSVDSKAFVQYYLSLKPTISEIYAEISTPNSTFDDALSKSISMVLNTPVIYNEIEVNSPSVMYLYSDPKLENLNDAQKLLLRMGPQNLAKIKHKLRSIQAELSIVNH